MAKLDTTHRTAEDALNAAQGVFTANPVYQPAPFHVLAAQDRLQDAVRSETEAFSAAWFKRREAAVHAATQAMTQIPLEAMHNPAGVMKIMTDWQSGAVARMTEDAQDIMQLMTQYGKKVAKSEIETAEEIAKSQGVFTKKRHATPV